MKCLYESFVFSQFYQHPVNQGICKVNFVWQLLRSVWVFGYTNVITLFTTVSPCRCLCLNFLLFISRKWKCLQIKNESQEKSPDNSFAALCYVIWWERTSRSVEEPGRWRHRCLLHLKHHCYRVEQPLFWFWRSLSLPCGLSWPKLLIVLSQSPKCLQCWWKPPGMAHKFIITNRCFFFSDVPFYLILCWSYASC